MLLAGMTVRHHSSIYGFTDFQELYQSNHGMARNREAGGFVNSAVKGVLGIVPVEAMVCVKPVSNELAVSIYIYTCFSPLIKHFLIISCNIALYSSCCVGT